MANLPTTNPPMANPLTTNPSPFQEFNQLRGFEFPVACTGLSISPNRKRILAIGTYKPSVKLFDLANISVKFERHLSADALRVVPLTEDADKFAILRRDRRIEFHTRNGLHEQIELPYQPRDILFNPATAEIYACGPFSTIYRINLEQGRFLNGFPVSSYAMALSRASGLLCLVSESATRIFDTSSRTVVSTLPRTEHAPSTVAMSADGLCCAVGSVDGTILEWDLRTAGPSRTLQADSAVSKVLYDGGEIFGATSTSINCFSPDGSTERVEPGFEISDFDVAGGMLVVGGEEEEMKCYLGRGCTVMTDRSG